MFRPTTHRTLLNEDGTMAGKEQSIDCDAAVQVARVTVSECEDAIERARFSLRSLAETQRRIAETEDRIRRTDRLLSAIEQEMVFERIKRDSSSAQ